MGRRRGRECARSVHKNVREKCCRYRSHRQRFPSNEKSMLHLNLPSLPPARLPKCKFFMKIRRAANAGKKQRYCKVRPRFLPWRRQDSRGGVRSAYKRDRLRWNFPLSCNYIYGTRVGVYPSAPRAAQYEATVPSRRSHLSLATLVAVVAVAVALRPSP
ncbi:hypothetical protein PUN28_018936 [Cardiocondyla obscurior]|uniref:Uncharacterized protein n=1 Tax=Cardiocondyla obscurior TaxID=286306 RepID=A0AAW2EGH3_9HYME